MRRAHHASVTSRPQTSTRPPSGLRKPTSASTSSFWPLPATPAIPTISPPRTVRLTRSTTSLPEGDAIVTSSALRSGFARLQRSLLHFEIDVAASHRPHDLACVGVGGAQVRDGAAVTQDRDPVGDRRHFMQLVRYEQHGSSVGGEGF